MTGRLAIDGGEPVRPQKRFLVYGRPTLEQAEVNEVVECLRSGWIGTGPRAAQFERDFAAYIGTRHAIAVSSCTAALHLSMIVAGVGPGDEVITTPLTFAATANAVVHTGATPVFADVDRTTFNIDPERIAAAVTPRTRAVVPVDFAGRPVDYAAIEELARAHGLHVVEDAAHCIEGEAHGRKTGTVAAATCFSFYVTKNITTVEGGMITTDRDEWAANLRIRALHGLSADAWTRFSDANFTHYEVVAPGFKYNLADILASVGIHQLRRIETWHARREQLWRRYDEAFADLPVQLPAPAERGTRHARHLYTLLVDRDRLTASRDQILDAIHAEGVGCGVHYTAVHLHEYYRKAYRLEPDDFPNATYISQRTLSIPLSPGLSDQDAGDVIAAVRKVLTAYTR